MRWSQNKESVPVCGFADRERQVDRHRIGVGGRIRDAVRAAPSSGMPAIDCVTLHSFASFPYQVREGRQRHQLAGGEEVGKVVIP